MSANDEYPVLSLSILDKERRYTRATADAVRVVTNRQDSWLEDRLSELGMSVGRRKWNRKWVTDEYVTGVRQGNQGGR